MMPGLIVCLKIGIVLATFGNVVAYIGIDYTGCESDEECVRILGSAYTCKNMFGGIAPIGDFMTFG